MSLRLSNKGWSFDIIFKGEVNMGEFTYHAVKIAEDEPTATVAIKNDSSEFSITNVNPKSHSIIQEVRGQMANGLYPKEISLGHLLVKMFSL